MGQRRMGSDFQTHNAELRRLQAELEAARARYLELFDLAPVGLLTLDQRGVILEANLAAARLLGAARDTLVRQPLTAFILPQDRDEHQRRYNALWATRQKQTWEVRLVGPEDDPCSARLDAIAAPEMAGGAPVCRVAVTDRKRAQLAVEASEARYRSFVTASAKVVWITDPQGLVQDDLPTWREFTGQSYEQARGSGWVDALHPDDRPRAAALWSRAVATRTLYAVEYRVRRHDGQYRWMSVHGVPVLKPDGTVHEWVGACSDITEQKQTEAEMQRMREELGHVDRAARLGELTASLAHELSQPLAAILSNAQAARRRLAGAAPDLELMREIIDDIIRDDKRAGSVIHRLRLMLRKGAQEPEWFHVNDAVREVVQQLVHGESVGRNATLSMDLAAELPPLLAARVEVQQVLVNLVVNALDAVKDLPADRRDIVIRTRADGDAVVVAVRDRGCGIQAPDVNSIFESFYTTKPVGLGMGLAICRRMIEARGGRIWAANNEDAGATVYFSLPLTPATGKPSDG